MDLLFLQVLCLSITTLSTRASKSLTYHLCLFLTCVAQLLRVSRLCVGLFGLVMGCLAVVLQAIGLELG